MSPRERIRTACTHRQPDRVPIDFGGHRSSGISAIAYARLKEFLGIRTGQIYVYDIIQQLAIIEREVMDATGTDVVELGRGFLTGDSDWKDWVLPDGTPCKIPSYIDLKKKGDDWYLLNDNGRELAVQSQGCLYFEQIHWPWLEKDPDLQDFSDLEEAFSDCMWTDRATPGGHLPLDESGRDQLRAGAQKLRKSTDRAILGIFGGNLFEVPQALYRNQEYFMHMAAHPEACERLSEALCNHYLDKLEKWMEAVGPYVDVVLFGDDLGGQNGPLMSLDMYRRYFKPYEKRLWTRAKELAPHAVIQLHSCGGIEPLLDDLMDAGLEASNPVQITCKGMDPQHLKTTYGARFVFWGGGCDTRRVLPQGTPEEVRRHVTRLLDTWSPGGGYVFQQVHNIQADVPPENVMAMFDAVQSYS